MNWFRQTLQKHRVTFLALLSVNVFFMVDGTSTLYAHELKQHERVLFTQRLASTFGLPLDRFQNHRPTLEERFNDFRQAMEPPLAEAETRIEDLAEEILDDIDTISWWAAAPRQHAAPPQEPATGSRSTAMPRPEMPTKPIPVIDGSNHASVTSRSKQGPAPLTRVEKKARTVSGKTSALSSKVSAVATPSTPRRVIPKAGIAPEITALATSLDNSPARIFRFVHDTIGFDPKWGAGKSPLGTLQEGLGTSWEQAWLLLELLTAAGVDARTEWGEVEIPTELMLQIAGVADPFRAGDLLTTAGMPIVLVVEGSQVIHARMSHVWVKAHLDYIPRRGVTAGPGDTWLRMDPSLKQFETTAGTRLDEAVPYDLGAYLQSGTESSPRQVYDEAIQAHITDQNLGITLDQVKPGKEILEEAFPFVPGTLRAKILNVTSESTTVPESFQQRLELQVREDVGTTLLTWSTPWPSVYGKRLELAWPGATAADQATLDLYGGVFVAPPYEVDLAPSLRLDGAELVTGPAIGSAEDITVVVTITPPSGPANVVPFATRAGEHAILNLDFGRQPQEIIDRFTTEQANASDAAEIEAWGLARAAAVYLQTVSSDVDHLAALRGLRRVQIGNVALAIQRGAVSVAPDGTPLTFSAAPPAVDLGSMILGLFPADGAAASSSAAVATLELIGSHASFIEGEALATALGGEHLTAVTALTQAVREGQVLTRVDTANVDVALADADLGDDAEGSVQAGVGAGQIAWIHQTQLEHLSWDAAGYVLENPTTGAGGYFVTYERLLEPLDATITFHAPLDLDEVTAPTDVVATIDGDDIDSWTLSYKSAEGGDAVVIATGSGTVSNETLGQLDPTLLLNGMVDLVLTARNAAGQTASQKITVVVGGQMKIGHFTLSFVDLAVPVSGLDIEVVRTYDSRDKRQGDFGIGWSLDIRQGSYRNNRPPGDGWQLAQSFLPCDSVVESKSHRTTIRLSDQEVYRFALRLQNGVPSTGGGCFADTRFDFVDGPIPGATLEILGNTQVFWETGSNRVINFDTLDLFEPQQVRLTTRDGRIFDLDLAAGVTGVEDQNGNRLEIDGDGIRHSSGREISFTRDQDDRIVTITDPLNNTMSYGYDASGDLISFTDRASAVTAFTYDSNHRVLNIEDARGINPLRNEYDTDGRLVRHIDAFGKVIELGHDLDNRREVVTDRLGASRVLEYDTQGNLTREIDELGHVTVRTFDGRSNPLSETDPLGRTTTYTYSTADDLASLTDPLGQITTYTYDGRSRLLTVTNPRGQVTTNTYDARGNLLTNIDSAGSVTTHTYNTRGDLVSLADSSGATQTFTYDAFGNLTRATDPLGNATDSTYDSVGNRLTETRTRTLADGSTEELKTLFVYDSLDQLITTTAPDGSNTSRIYDALGKVVADTDQLGRVTTMTYDLMGRLVTTTYADGTTESIGYDAEDRMVTQVDRSGRTTTFQYDLAGRLLSTSYPDGGTTTNAYDDANQLVATTNVRGYVTSYLFDVAGRLTSITDALGSESHLAYDLNGNQASITDALGQITTFTYDHLDRLVATTFPDGSTTSASYDELSRKVSATDQAGVTTYYGYDALGRLSNTTDALSQVTSYTYDEVGNRTSQTDANGNVTAFGYDQIGRLTSRIFPDGNRESLIYNGDGTLASHTNFNGVTRTFQYESNQRLTRLGYPDGSIVTFTYTPTGQRATVTDTRGTTSYSYDSRDRLTQKIEPNGYELGYTYDTRGNRTGLTATVGSEVYSSTYSYDALDRLTTITDSQGGVSTLGYNVVGNRTSLIFPNSIGTTYSYDGLNRLTDLESKTSDGSVVQNYQLSLGQNGNRKRIDEHDGTSRHYIHDELYRLKQDRVTGPSGSLVYQHDFSYDPVGNRLQRVIDEGTAPTIFTSSYDSRDRLLTNATTSYSWDSNGNLTAKSEGTTTTYQWDFEDRLTSLNLDDGTLVETTYDPDGHRVRTVVTPPGGPAQSVDHLVDSAGSLSHVVADIVNGSVQTLYTRAEDQLIGLYRPGAETKKYIHADALGSVRVLSNEAGVVTDRYSYTAFGEQLQQSGTDPQPYRFAGEPYSPNSGLYYNRARWLDVDSGRFVGVDPFSGRINDPLSLHRYLYAHLNPTLARDPSGRESIIGQSIASAVQGTIAAVNTGRTLGYIWVSQATALLAGGMSFILYRGPQVLQLLRGTGTLGTRALQRIFLRSNGIVTQAQALKTSTWSSWSRMRPALNRLITGGAKNPAGIQWHHIVEQQAGRFLGPNAAQAINSIANVVPTPIRVHRAISGFYSSKPTWVAQQGFRNFRHWLSGKSWEEQYRIGLEIWQRAMNTGVANYVP